MSYGSEVNQQTSMLGADDSSNDGLVIVDDANPSGESNNLIKIQLFILLSSYCRMKI